MTTSHLAGGERGPVAKARTATRGTCPRLSGDTCDLTSQHRQRCRNPARLCADSPFLAITERAAAAVIAKHIGVLAAADIEIFTRTTTLAILQSLRLDYGPSGPVHL